MHHLLISVDGKKVELTAQEFAQEFGTSFKDTSVLYTCMGSCFEKWVTHTDKDFKKYRKQVDKEWKLKKQIRGLRYQLFREKSKNISSIVKGN